MTDTFKEFYNGSPSYSDLVAGVTITAPGSSVQHAVKEILLRSTSFRSFSLWRDTMKLIDWAGSGMAKGLELVPATKTLLLKTDSRALFNRLITYQNSTTIRTFNTRTVFNDDTASTTESSAAPYVDATVTVLTVTPDFFAVDASGNFYYSDRSTATLYRRAGGVNGAQTAIAFGSQVKCWDGSRYIYGMDGGNNFKVYDTQTGVVTMMAMTGGGVGNANSAMARLCALDGYLFAIGANAADLLIYNASTGAKVGAIAGIGQSSTTLLPLEVQKDDEGNYYLLHFNASGTIQVVSIGPDPSAPLGTIRSVNLNHGINMPTGAPWLNSVFKTLNAPGVIFGIASSTMKMFDVVTAEALKTHTINSFSVAACFHQVDSASANSHFGTVTARAIGVEVS